VQRFPLRWSPPYQAAALAFGVTPGRAWVDVGDGRLEARFGFWLVQTTLANVAGTEVTGPYRRVTTLGPAHLSLSDRGLTFASHRGPGLCIRFHEPVTGLEPRGRLRHPGLTVTVADIEGLAAHLAGPDTSPPPQDFRPPAGRS
jgi:hypothetical protein